MLIALNLGDPMRINGIKPLPIVLGIVGFSILLFIVMGSIQANAHRSGEASSNQARSSSPSGPGVELPAPADLLKRAAACLGDPSPDNFLEAEKLLNQVPSSAPESQEAARLKAGIPAARMKYRADIVHDLQESYRASGKRVSVSLTGPSRENVRFYWPGMTMADVSSMQGAFGTLRDFRDSGCKTFTMTDGVGISQQIDLTTVP